MKKKVINAFGWDFAGLTARYGATFITSVILARLLTPEEFGLVAIALVFITIFSSFADFGFKSALIQNQVNDETTYSSIFFINVILGLLLSIIFFLLSGQIAIYFENPEIESLVKFLSALFTINSLGFVQKAIFTINLDFKKITLISLISQTVAGLIGVVLAFLGFGVYALVFQILLFAIFETCSYWISSNWRPIIVFNFRAVRTLFSFGVYVFLNQGARLIVKNIDELVIAKIFSIQTLGFFGRANSFFNTITNFVSSSIKNVAFPVLSSLKDDDKRFNDIYIKGYSVICCFAFFVSGIFILTSEEVIIGIFGNQWQESVVIFEILMFRMFFPPTNAFLLMAILAKGKAKESFWHGMVRKLIRLSSIVVAYYYGFIPFLYYLVGISYLTVFYNNYINSYYLNISFKKQVSELFSFFFIFGFGILFSKCIISESGFSVFEATTRALFFTAIYISLIYLMKKELFLFVKNELMNQLKRFI